MQKTQTKMDGRKKKGEWRYVSDTEKNVWREKGVAVKPSEGEFRAPLSGEVTVMFDTGHAVSIRGDNGAEVIVHIGLDTVQLKGQYFTAHVKQGDRVQAGDLLITADLEQIRAAGYDVITPVLICNTPDFPDMVCHTGMQVKSADPIITL